VIRRKWSWKVERLAHSGRVDDGRKAFQVVDDAVVEQLGVGGPQGLQDLVSLQLTGGPVQLCHHPECSKESISFYYLFIYLFKYECWGALNAAYSDSSSFNAVYLPRLGVLTAACTCLLMRMCMKKYGGALNAAKWAFTTPVRAGWWVGSADQCLPLTLNAACS